MQLCFDSQASLCMYDVTSSSTCPNGIYGEKTAELPEMDLDVVKMELNSTLSKTNTYKQDLVGLLEQCGNYVCP